MAFSKVPTAWIPNWSEDGTDIIVPIATFPQLTAAEADAATGDIRKILFGVADALVNAWIAKAAADRPAKMTLSRSTSVNDQTGAVSRRYVFDFELSTVAEEVADEPA